MNFLQKIKEMKAENKLLAVSIAAGILAAAAGYGYLTWKENNVMSGMKPVKVLAAAVYIASSSEIKKENVGYMEMPAKYVTEAHITDFKKAENKLALVPFIKGEPILANKISDRGSELNMAIPTGLRAVSVPVNEESGVGFMIKPGDNVDVLLTFETSEGKKIYTVTATVLQSVQVIAVGSDFGKVSKGSMYASVTLALTPEEAEILTFSKDKGRINLALRPLGDRTREKVKLASFNELVQQIKNIEKGDEEIKHDFVMQTVRQKEPVPSGIAAETAIKPR